MIKPGDWRVIYDEPHPRTGEQMITHWLDYESAKSYAQVFGGTLECRWWVLRWYKKHYGGVRVGNK